MKAPRNERRVKQRYTLTLAVSSSAAFRIVREAVRIFWKVPASGDVVQLVRTLPPRCSPFLLNRLDFPAFLPVDK